MIPRYIWQISDTVILVSMIDVTDTRNSHVCFSCGKYIIGCSGGCLIRLGFQLLISNLKAAAVLNKIFQLIYLHAKVSSVVFMHLGRLVISSNTSG